MRWDIGSTPSINRMSVLEAPLSLINASDMHQISSEIVGIERRGGEAVKLPNVVPIYA